MQYRLIDSHSHVQFPAYVDDRDAVIRRAFESGVGVVNVGTQHATSLDAIRLAERYNNGVWATVGCHPNHTDLDSHHDPLELTAKRHEAFDVERFLTPAQHPKVVAIGECGLDFYRMQGQESRMQKRQTEVFVEQIELAWELKKPLIVHCRRAFSDLMRILDSTFQILNAPAGVVHFFSGSWEDARRLLGLGFCIGFGGVITFARDYDGVVQRVPLDRLLVETDAPYVAPIPHRGTRNEPAFIVETVRKIAELRGIDYDEVASATVANTRQLFRL